MNLEPDILNNAKVKSLIFSIKFYLRLADCTFIGLTVCYIGAVSF